MEMREIESGDIIFVKGKTVVSQFIKFFDKGKFSHVCIAITPHLVLEAQYGTKVRITPFRFKIEDCEIVKLPLNDRQKRLITNHATLFTGKKYDYLQLLSYIFKGVDIDKQNCYICSELVSLILSMVGYEECEFEKDLSPNQLYNHLMEHLKGVNHNEKKNRFNTN